MCTRLWAIETSASGPLAARGLNTATRLSGVTSLETYSTMVALQTGIGHSIELQAPDQHATGMGTEKDMPHGVCGAAGS